MDLPPGLKSAVERALAGLSTDALAGAATLSARYRAELRDGRFHVDDDLAAAAYLAARLPGDLCGDAERPRGGEPEAPRLAAGDAARSRLRPRHGRLRRARLLARPCRRDAGRGEPRHAPPCRAPRGRRPAPRRWRGDDLAKRPPDFEPHDLVTIAYVLDELSPEAGAQLVAAAWRATAALLVIVEPGTPAGWRRILAARDALIAAGATISAPCPHEAPCPILPPDWCHFAVRLARAPAASAHQAGPCAL